MLRRRITFWLAAFWLIQVFRASQPLFAFDDPKLTLDQLRERIASTRDNEQVQYKLLVLTRFDFPADYRIQISEELIKQFEAVDDPLILGKAYCGKGTGLMHQGDLNAAIEFLERGESCGKRCVAKDPNVFFKPRCNRAACLTILGKSLEAASLLQEALEYAKPYGDKLDVPFVYTLLAHHAEQAGAIDLALKYLSSAFEIAMRSDKPLLAAQAGTSAVGMLIVNSLTAEAQTWVDKLEPLIGSVNDPAVKIAFAMYREDLRSRLGEHATAIENLKLIALEAETLGNPQTIGNAYLTLAAAEKAAENYDAAIAAAEKAIAQLTNVPRSLFLAKMHRAEALFATGRDSGALEATDEILNQDEAYPKLKARELRSRILRQQGRSDEAFEQLQIVRDEEQQRMSVQAKEQAAFMTSTLENQLRAAELKISEEQRRSAEVQAAFDRMTRNTVLVASLLTLAGGALFFRSNSKRKTALAIAAREHELNLELSKNLAAQTKALNDELARRLQLEKTVERKHRDETIGKLTGGVAHDFNNLLTIIMQSTELAKLSGAPLAPDVTQLLDASLRAAESGASIVSQLLAYARQQPLSPRPVNISEWLSSSLGMFQQISGKRLSCEQSESIAHATISTDPAQLTSAVINLVANARDAINVEHGEIKLRVTTISLDESSVHNWTDVAPGDYAMFEVIDNGVGMSPDQRERACEPFFSTKGPSAGTGLGLSSALGFVKQSSGDLKIESTLGQGTTVSFILPIINH